MTERYEFLDALETLAKHRVRFVVIGGLGGGLRGSTTVTDDVDICYARDRDNLERMARALRELHATLRGAPKDVPFLLDAGTLEMGDSFTYDTDAGGRAERRGGSERTTRRSDGAERADPAEARPHGDRGGPVLACRERGPQRIGYAPGPDHVGGTVVEGQVVPAGVVTGASVRPQPEDLAGDRPGPAEVGDRAHQRDHGPDTDDHGAGPGRHGDPSDEGHQPGRVTGLGV